jgi:hypothetical protein
LGYFHIGCGEILRNNAVRRTGCRQSTRVQPDRFVAKLMDHCRIVSDQYDRTAIGLEAGDPIKALALKRVIAN